MSSWDSVRGLLKSQNPEEVLFCRVSDLSFHKAPLCPIAVPEAANLKSPTTPAQDGAAPWCSRLPPHPPTKVVVAALRPDLFCPLNPSTMLHRGLSLGVSGDRAAQAAPCVALISSAASQIAVLLNSSYPATSGPCSLSGLHHHSM